MVGYKPHSPTWVRSRMGQQAPIMPAATPPPGPDPLFTGYTGAAGVLETVAVVGITGAAAWLGISIATTPFQPPTRRTLGWIGGVGSALLGVLYIAGKSGLNQAVNLPAVRVTPV